MGEIESNQICQEMSFKKNDDSLQWAFIKAKDDACNYDLMHSDLDDSLESSSSTDLIDDASSSSSSTSSTPSSTCSPLFELSDLMAHLPIKRGISKFYQGKSESFTSLTSVKSVADLAKKDKYCCRSRSQMKRYGQSQRLSPKATISKNKKAAASSSSSSTTTKSSVFSSLGKMSSLMAN